MDQGLGYEGEMICKYHCNTNMNESVITISMLAYKHLNFIRDAIEGALIQNTKSPKAGGNYYSKALEI